MEDCSRLAQEFLDAKKESVMKGKFQKLGFGTVPGLGTHVPEEHVYLGLHGGLQPARPRNSRRKAD